MSDETTSDATYTHEKNMKGYLPEAANSQSLKEFLGIMFKTLPQSS
jgi:hypothetical protein